MRRKRGEKEGERERGGGEGERGRISSTYCVTSQDQSEGSDTTDRPIERSKVEPVIEDVCPTALTSLELRRAPIRRLGGITVRLEGIQLTEAWDTNCTASETEA